LTTPRAEPRYRPPRGRCLLLPELDRVPLLLRGLDTYELTGKPRTPAYARVVEMGLAAPNTGETLCKIGDVVFLDLASVSVEVMTDRKKHWVAPLEALIAVINEPRGKPVPLNDFFLTEEAPRETLAQYAPGLAETDFFLDNDTIKRGLASDTKSASKKTKVFTYKYERVRALGLGKFVNKGWRPQDPVHLDKLACISGLRSMNIDWVENGKAHSGSVTPFADLFFSVEP
jgi:hypothetical protein